MTVIDRRYGVAESLAVKAPCRVATTGQTTLSGLQTIDGVALAADDRVLVKSQTLTVENGIYVAASGLWTRDLDFDGVLDVVTGTRVWVTSGTVNSAQEFFITTADPIIIGTTGITFASGVLTTLLDFGTATVPMALASESPQANETVKLLFRSYHSGPHTGSTISAVGIETHATGGHVNGPDNADHSLTISISKIGYDGNTGLKGEIDALRIYVRQNGPDATGSPTIQSDTNALTINIATRGKTGNAAQLEGIVTGFATDGVTTLFRVHSQVGSLNNINGAIYGFIADAEVGAAGTGQNYGLLVRNISSGGWDYPVRFENSAGRILGGLNSAGNVVLGGATSGTTVLVPQAVAAGTITFPANSTVVAGLSVVETWLSNQTFNDGTLILAGGTSGASVLRANAIAAGAIFLPANSTVLAGLNITQTWLQPQGFNDGNFILNKASGGGITVKAQDIAGDQTITLPAATDTLVGKATTDTLTNKTIDASQLTGTVVSARISGSYTGITGVGTLTAGATGAGFTIALATSTITGTLGPAAGGTGIANNAASTITISGNFASTFTVSGTTAVTFPTSGTLATLAGTEEFTNKTLNASVGKGTWTASGTWTLPAHTLGGTVSGGGNNINNVIIGAVTPLAGTFTTLTGTAGSISGLTTLAIRDTSAAFDVTMAAVSSTALTAGRTLTLDMGNVAHTLKFGTTANTITFPNAASDTVAMLAVANAFTGTMTLSPSAGANLTLGGNATPQIVFSPSSGATKSAQFYQQADSWRIADAGVSDRMSLVLATGAVTFLAGTAIPAGGTGGSGIMFSSTANYGVFFGSGAPTLSAAKGSLYLRSDGTTTNDRAYINTNGSTTWTALTTAA